MHSETNLKKEKKMFSILARCKEAALYVCTHGAHSLTPLMVQRSRQAGRLVGLSHHCTLEGQSGRQPAGGFL